MQFDVRHNVEQVRAELHLQGRETVQAMVRALNRTLVTARKDAATELKKEYPSLKVGQIKARIKMGRALPAQPVATLTFSGKRFSLFGKFGMSSKGKWGVGFSRLPWRVETISGEKVSSELLARAFRQRSNRSGRADAYTRLGRARESFEILLAPGVARAFGERQLGAALERSIRTRFPVALRQEARFLVSRRSPQGG